MRRTIPVLPLLLLAAVLGAAGAAPPPVPDALDEALALAGLHRADLGWRPQGYWHGYPADIPFKLRQFDDLLAEPLANIPYLQTMAQAARLSLDPARLDDQPARNSAGQLYTAAARLGVIRKNGQFRSYSCNLTAQPTPMRDAILKVYDHADRATRFVTFGDESPYPLLEQDLAAAVDSLPHAVRPILGKLLINILDAQRWADLAFRNVPLEDRLVVAQRMNLGMESVDALEYCPRIDDVARNWDECSLWYAGLKCVEALDQARKELKDIPADGAAFSFKWLSPLGWIIINGAGDDIIETDDALLIIDLGGNDEYRGSVAASNATRRIGLLLDLAGDDTYTGGSIAQGAGVCGVGVLLDVTGDDAYHAREYAQGAGQFGFGACIDLDGNDAYASCVSSQGCGFFGIGLHLDAAGHDVYSLHADGQGFGGVAGVGVLADHTGNDRYLVERDPDITGRPSYHSDRKISVSNAQGCAMGRRGDGADGHAWAGGIGALIDIHGNDEYVAGNWAMGCGYWFGMGFLYDGDGDDTYRGVAWTQGSGAHFCIGVLLDEGGDDRHLVEEYGMNSLAFGHDFTVALLVNRGGNDLYETETNGLGYAINRSVAALIDVGGDDVYRGNPANRPGMAHYDASRMTDRDDYTTYFADSSSLGLFLDVGGLDTFAPARALPQRRVLRPVDDSAPAPAAPDDPAGTIAACANDATWLDEPDSPNWAARNFSIGVDRAGGTIDFRPIPQKPPSGLPAQLAPPPPPR